MEPRAVRDALRRSPGAPLALATVVGVAGSAYRQPGARMVISADEGPLAGAISAGCLEGDVWERARAVVAAGRAEVAVYDTRGDDRDVWGFSMGCNGVVRVLIEPLAGPDAAELARFLDDRIATRTPGVMASVVATQGPAEAAVGDRLLADGAGVWARGGLAAPRWHEAACRATAAARESGTLSLRDESASVELFCQVVEPPPALVVFGTGPGALPLARMAGELGWEVRVVDDRGESRGSAPLAPWASVSACRPEQLADACGLVPPGAAALVMTHHYGHDREILSYLLGTGARYIGVVGSRARTESLLREVGGGCACRVHGPAGLGLGGGSPAEIALAIVAEIQLVLCGGSGAPLRDRPGPIHAPPAGTHTRPAALPAGAVAWGWDPAAS